MLLICNKHSKKLFLALTTPRAIAGHTNLSFNDVKVFSFEDISFYVTRQWVMKFNNPATAETQQVVMFSQRLHLIVVVGFIKMDFLYQTQFLEPPQGTIDRG
jgi:hypothetical protein